jgi:NitT/TauT family transport system permease protein
MKSEFLYRLPGWVLPSIAMMGMLAVWEAVSRIFKVPLYILPAPSVILMASIDGMNQLGWHSLFTLYQTLVGFALASLLGVALGIAIVSSRLLRATFYPILLVIQSVPKVALAPVLLITLGFGELPKIIIVFLVAFFPIVVSTASGLDSAPREILDLARVMSASRVDTFRKIRFPAAMPQIFVGLKLSMTLAVIGAVIADFVGSDRGLGYLILISTSQANTPLAFGAIVVLAAISIVLFYAVELVERWVVFWAEEN